MAQHRSEEDDGWRELVVDVAQDAIVGAVGMVADGVGLAVDVATTLAELFLTVVVAGVSALLT